MWLDSLGKFPTGPRLYTKCERKTTVRDGTKKNWALKRGRGPGAGEAERMSSFYAKDIPLFLQSRRLAETTEMVWGEKKSTNTYTQQIFSTNLDESLVWPQKNLRNPISEKSILSDHLHAFRPECPPSPRILMVNPSGREGRLLQPFSMVSPDLLTVYPAKQQAH